MWFIDITPTNGFVSLKFDYLLIRRPIGYAFCWAPANMYNLTLSGNKFICWALVAAMIHTPFMRKLLVSWAKKCNFMDIISTAS